MADVVGNIDYDEWNSTILALQVDVAAMQADVLAMQVDIAAMQVTIAALLVLTETGGTVTTDGTEQDIYLNNAPAALYRPVCVKIDFTNHGAGETCVVRIYYRIASGGNLIKQVENTYAAAQDPALISLDLEPNRYGIQVTIEKTAGANQAYPWEVCYEV